MSNQTPPKWAPNAVPTIYGWADPKTGELLVSKKGLENVVTDFGKNKRPTAKPDIVETPVSNIDITLDITSPETLVENTFVELEVESATPEVSVPEVIDLPKRRSSRSKKRA